MADTMTERRVSRATLASQLEEAIRVEIIEGVLTPGQRLRANDLTHRYGVSATPLREALQRLAAQNLVDIDPRLGATVAEISRTDLRDIYSLRELLEGIALERSIEHADDAWETRVGEAWERFRAHSSIGQNAETREAIAWSQAHRQFHEALYSACQSPWLLRFIETLYDHSERYRMLSVRSKMRLTTEEHEGIYRPSIERNAPEAVAWLRKHLHDTVAHLEQGIPTRDNDGAALSLDGAALSLDGSEGDGASAEEIRDNWDSTE
jgi:GntR family transcriptional regulator, carbon starvation induced regulator